MAALRGITGEWSIQRRGTVEIPCHHVNSDRSHLSGSKCGNVLLCAPPDTDHLFLHQVLENGCVCLRVRKNVCKYFARIHV